MNSNISSEISTQDKIIELMESLPATRNSELLISFVKACFQHTDGRFWQVLSNWSGWPYIFFSKERPVHHNESLIWREHEIHDPYYWERNRNNDPYYMERQKNDTDKD